MWADLDIEYDHDVHCIPLVSVNSVREVAKCISFLRKFVRKMI